MNNMNTSSKKTSKKNTIKLTEEHIQNNGENILENVTENNLENTIVNKDCPICIEKYNNSTRKNIKCEYCTFEACKECYQKYLLNENEPNCMSNDCNRQWTPEFISIHFTKKFINNDLKSHLEKVLFDKQRALMPSTQPIIENLIKREEYIDRINKASNVVKEARDKMFEIQREYHIFINSSKNSTEARSFIRACPVSTCKGFLSTQWKCGICQNFTCPTCHEVKGLVRDCEHTCNPDNVATANLLNSDTKPCPNCGEGIFKIDGCDQLWCTLCHVAFSWRTGKIETVIHNPHYYEWMRRNGTIERDPNDVQCGREITHNTIVTIRNHLTAQENINSEHVKEIKTLLKLITEKCRKIIHIRYVSLNTYNVNNDNNVEQLRIQYMRNFISENYFKTNLQREHKKKNKYNEIYQVLQLLINTVTDIIYNFIDEIKYKEWKYNLDRYNDIVKIIEYADECFLKISRTYNSIPLTFNKL
jgi:hypothetical protein